MKRFPTLEERYPRRGEPLPQYIEATGGTETIIHDSCGTPDCCMSCETAVPVQLEFNFSKDTKSKPLSFDGGAKYIE